MNEFLKKQITGNNASDMVLVNLQWTYPTLRCTVILGIPDNIDYLNIQVM